MRGGGFLVVWGGVKNEYNSMESNHKSFTQQST